MSRLFIALTGLAAVLTAAALPAAGSAKPPKRPKGCPTTNIGDAAVTLKARTINLRTAKLVVYTKTNNDTYVMYGCLRKTRKRTQLTSWYSCECSTGDDAAPRVKVAGRFVALDHVSYNAPYRPDDSTGSLSVVDLASGRALFSYRTRGAADVLVLKNNGSVAFALEPVPDSGYGYAGAFDGRLVRIDKTGTTTLVQSMRGIDKDSLAISANGRYIYWTEQGQYKGAPID